MKSRFFVNAGKWIGVGSAVTTLVLWEVLAYTSQSSPATTRETWLVIAAMVALAIAGLLTAWAERPLLMIFIFLFSFFPAGLYLLGVPSIFRLIGISDLVFFLASILILGKRYGISIHRKG